MIDYKQPDFYRFNEDSLILVNFVSEKVPQANSILDLGAGSGIIGIELANKLLPQELTLLDVQVEWEEYLKYNLKTFLKPAIQSEIIISSFGKWLPDNKYDLIVCNPPYFLPGHGKKSPDQRKNIARSFEIDGWNVLLETMENALAPTGHAFIVIRYDDRVISLLPREIIEVHRKGNLAIIILTACK